MAYKYLSVIAIFAVLSGIIYNFIPSKKRYIVLLALSYAGIIAMSGYGALCILFTALTTYAAGLLIEYISGKKKLKDLSKEEKKKVKAKLTRQKKLVVFVYILLNIGLLSVIK